MKATLLVLVVAAAAAMAVPVQWLELGRATSLHKTSRLGDVFTFCNKSLDPLVILSVNLTPDPPVKGQPLTVSVRYDLKEDVTSGEVKVEAKLDGIPVYSNTMALCDVAKQAGVQCPIKPFVGSNSTTVTLPNIGGHITASAMATDQNDKELACVEVDVRL